MKNKVKYNLSELRLANDMTQQEMANKLTIAVSTYNMYENGTRNVPMKVATGIAKLLGVELDDIFLAVKFTVSK